MLCSERTVTSNIFQHENHETSTAGPSDHWTYWTAGVAFRLSSYTVKALQPESWRNPWVLGECACLVPDFSPIAWCQTQRQHETAWDMRRHMSPNNTKHSRVPFLDPRTPLSRIALLRMIWSKMKKYNSSVIHALLSAVGVLCRLLVFWRGQIVFDTLSGTGLVGSNQPFSVIRKSDIANGLGERYERCRKMQKDGTWTSWLSCSLSEACGALLPATDLCNLRLPPRQRCPVAKDQRVHNAPEQLRVQEVWGAEGIRGNPRESEGIRGNPRESEGIRGTDLCYLWGIFGDRAAEFRMTNSTKTYWE